jgi:hypothetical protein
MKIVSYKYVVNFVDPDGYMTPQYIKLVKDYLETVKLTGKTAVLYAGGVLLSASEARNTVDTGKLRRNVQESTLAVKELSAYSMHRWIGILRDADKVAYANINGNTCASSLYSLYEAEKLLNDGFDDVIIIAEEKTSYNTLRVFKESRIDLKVGEGVAVMHLTKGGTDMHSCKWEFEYGRNPFGVTESGYQKVYQDCDMVKPHGTCTPNNEEAEQLVIGHKEQIRFKEDIGHCQGASGLIEICMLLDSEVKGTILCQAAGMGGFYGSCLVEK